MTNVTMLPKDELAKRHATVTNAIATQRLEGLEMNRETIADLESWARGEIELTTARERALARIEATRLRRLAEGAWPPAADPLAD
ncbi:hypothetical protein LMG28688_04964 [Paraburkholderia caffeinitolerans]|uniref:Antitoxin VbhA domain-containing protein n=1 Tax=Paraburkholderia caffeinitolerans TaxID=1723730 RepID=A0A6J5GG61_9BURK|nr:antitoxin [Paraburkholderia caffeinitolerans]CAB3799628.1 hypothetical protein LMG28688_04964 [Paraburkholderia caffeinitolerans]